MEEKEEEGEMTYRKLDSVVIVGGDAVGWMTALAAKKVLPTSNITVLHDGQRFSGATTTTPNFVFFLDSVGIPVSKLVAEAEGTIKTGSRYTGWAGDESSFYHGFTLASDYNLAALDNPDFMSNTSILWAMQESMPSSLDLVNFSWLTAEKNKITFIHNPEVAKEQFVVDPIFRYQSLGNFAVHFDTDKFVSMLAQIGTERGISSQITGIADVSRNEHGEICQISLENGQTLDCDFVFISSESFTQDSSDWQSYKEIFPVDRYVEYSSEQKEEIKPYTEVLAKSLGWTISIPLMNSIKSSYFYSSSSGGDSEELASGLEEHRIDSGYTRQSWTNNWVHVGSASHRIEPLAGLSFALSTVAVRDVLSDQHKMISRDPRYAIEYNNRHSDRCEQVASFTRLFYCGNSTDNEFWNKFRSIDDSLVSLKSFFRSIEFRLPEYTDFVGKIFALEDFVQISSGLRLFDRELCERICEANYVEDRLSRYKEMYAGHLNDSLQQCVSHREFVDNLRKQSIV
jgi:hypothetical protein